MTANLTDEQVAQADDAARIDAEVTRRLVNLIGELEQERDTYKELYAQAMMEVLMMRMKGKVVR